MATIAFEYKDGDLDGLTRYIEETKEKLTSDNFLTNPYKGNVYTINKEQRKVYLLTFTPIYPLMLLAYPCVIFAALIFLFNWNYWLYLIPTPIIALVLFFYSNAFFYLMFKIGLKKAAVNVTLKRVYTTELITLLVEQNGKSN